MERECSLGLMEENMKVTIMMTRNRDTECLHGQIKEDMMVNGLMENNMEKEFILLAKEKSEEGNGKKEKESDGLLMNELFLR